MTNLEALSANINYPLEDNKLEKALFDREVDPTRNYSLENKKAVDLATADIYVVLVTSANIQEGGYQISLTDKSNLIKLARATFKKYGEPDPFDETPKVGSISPW